MYLALRGVEAARRILLLQAAARHVLRRLRWLRDVAGARPLGRRVVAVVAAEAEAEARAARELAELECDPKCRPASGTRGRVGSWKSSSGCN